MGPCVTAVFEKVSEEDAAVRQSQEKEAKQMKKEKLKGNEKLRAVYANAASALTVQFNELKNKSKKPP